VAWENRERGGPYYTRSRREGGRVRREYVGSGPFAELCARSDKVLREKRELERLEGREHVARTEALAEPLEELDELAGALVRAALVAGGYHRHKGEWRMRRDA
jgi:hypothetical protein